MKKLVAPALFAVLALTGCAGSQATEPAPSVLPSPNAEQRTALLEQFASVDPGLARPRAVAAARMACKSLQSGHPATEQAQIIAGAFRMSGGKDLTAEQADRILTIVKDNGFCTQP